MEIQREFSQLTFNRLQYAQTTTTIMALPIKATNKVMCFVYLRDKIRVEVAGIVTQLLKKVT